MIIPYISIVLKIGLKIYSRDKNEKQMELSEEKKKEMQQKENVR